MITGSFVSLFPTDDVAPYFKTEPVRTQVHLEGNRLVLTCMAEGSWPLEFKWLHNNRELTKFSLEYRQASPPLPSPTLPSLLAARGTRVGACLAVWGQESPRQCYCEAGVTEVGGQRQPCPRSKRPCPAEFNRELGSTQTGDPCNREQSRGNGWGRGAHHQQLGCGPTCDQSPSSPTPEKSSAISWGH